jgi:hypothetical protein
MDQRALQMESKCERPAAPSSPLSVFTRAHFQAPVTDDPRPPCRCHHRRRTPFAPGPEGACDGRRRVERIAHAPSPSVTSDAELLSRSETLSCRGDAVACFERANHGGTPPGGWSRSVRCREVHLPPSFGGGADGNHPVVLSSGRRSRDVVGGSGFELGQRHEPLARDVIHKQILTAVDLR